MNLQKQNDVGQWVLAGHALVRADGTYEVPVAQAGTHRIEYTSLSRQFWARSAPMDLTRDSVETVDVTVQEGGSVSGTVTVEGTPDRAPEAFIAAYELVAGKSRVSFAVLVWAPGVPMTKVDGPLVVEAGGQQVGKGSVENGVALVDVTGQAKGRRSYTVTYAGNAKLRAGSRTVSVTVR